jgi:hypothetical protein
MPVVLAGAEVANLGAIRLVVETIPVKSCQIDCKSHNFSLSQGIGEFDAVIRFRQRPPGFIDLVPPAITDVKVQLNAAKQLTINLNGEDYYIFDYAGMLVTVLYMEEGLIFSRQQEWLPRTVRHG